MSRLRKVTAENNQRRSREQTLEAFRKKMKSNAYGRIVPFVMASLCACQVYHHGLTKVIDGESLILWQGAVYLVLGISSLLIGVTTICPDPRDKLLLILAEDILEKENQSNQPPLRTPVSGTPDADAPVAPACGRRLSLSVWQR